MAQSVLFPKPLPPWMTQAQDDGQWYTGPAIPLPTIARARDINVLHNGAITETSPFSVGTGINGLADLSNTAFRQHLLTGATSFNIEDRRTQKFTGPTKPIYGGMSLSSNGAPKAVIDTMIGEAGGHEGGLTAVAYTILNRSGRDKQQPDQVVKAPGQYAGYSNPGSAVKKAQNDPAVRAKAERIWQAVQTRSVPDPTNGGFNFRSDAAAHQLKGQTKSIGGNTFQLGSGAPQTASAAIDALVPPNPQSRPSALAYGDAPASVRAISVKPNGQAASLLDAMTAKFGSATPTMPGMTDQQVTGMSRPPAPPPPLISRPVDTVQINPNTGNPYTRQEITQQAANTEAARLRGDVTTSGRVANIPPIPSPVSHLPAAPPPPKVTISDGFGQQTDFNRANQDALLGAAKNIPVFGPIVSGAQSAANLLTAQPQRANAPAPTVYAPQRPTAAQLAAINYVPPPTVQTGRPTAAQLAAINDVSGVLPTSHTAVPSARIPPTSVLAFNGDQNTGIPAVGAMPPANPLPHTAAPVPHPYPITPPIRQPSAGLIPLSTFHTVNPGSQIVPQLQSWGNSTPIGHIGQLLAGEPVQGGIFSLFNKGGLLNSGRPANANAAPAPQIISPDTARYMQAQSDLRNSGMVNEFGQITGSNGHGDAAH